jgi:RNA polymerase sigma factor (sigma-70 family)
MFEERMAGPQSTVAEQDQALAETLRAEAPRLRSFIRRRVLNAGDAEDVLQDVFYELLQTYRLMKPVERAGAWMFRVARNRIADLFRRQRTVSLNESVDGEDGRVSFEDLLPSPDAGPDAVYARGVMVEAMEDALAELPATQREVFLAHEVEGKSFAEISAETGVAVNTLLSRKRRAVLHLRKRLEQFGREFGIEAREEQ